MEQMTLGKLIQELLAVYNADPNNRYKKVVTADDNEGNGYHGIFYSVTSDPNEVKANIDASNGLYDSVETNPNNLIIIG